VPERNTFWKKWAASVTEAPQSPLAGKKVVITRAAHQSAQLVAELLARNAQPIVLPMVSFAAPDDYAPMDAALQQWDRFDWVIFTSANAIDAIVSRSRALGHSLHQSGRPHIAAVGPATSEGAANAGFSVDYTARIHTGAALAQELGEKLRGQNVLLPRSQRANPDLPETLRRYGALVTEVLAYKTALPAETAQSDIERALMDQPDAILFFSPSAVANFVELLGRQQLIGLQQNTTIVAIGPVSASALRESGVQNILLSTDATLSAVIQSLETHFAHTRHTSAGVNRR
jgi:uroporphyrinogen-III synthase